VTLNGLSTQGSYVHYTGLLSTSFLRNLLQLQGQQMCPQTNICGAKCNGFCTCTGTVISSGLSCACPTCSNTSCTTNQCTVAATGCVGTPFLCNNGNQCQTGSCGAGGCVFTTLGNCTGAGCQCVSSVGCICNFPQCGPGNTCANTKCYTTICDTTKNLCVPSVATVCNDNDACTIDTCSQTSGCTYTPYQCPQAATCYPSKCIGTAPLPNGQPNCVQDVTQINCDDQDACTIDTCTQGIGCIHTNISCAAVNNSCSFPYACIGKDANGNALANGTCLIQNIPCGLTAAQIAGLSAGIIAGVVIGALLAAALIAFFTRQGYLAYQAQSAMASAAAKDNALFVDGGNTGYTHF